MGFACLWLKFFYKRFTLGVKNDKENIILSFLVHYLREIHRYV